MHVENSRRLRQIINQIINYDFDSFGQNARFSLTNSLNRSMQRRDHFYRHIYLYIDYNGICFHF